MKNMEFTKPDLSALEEKNEKEFSIDAFLHQNQRTVNLVREEQTKKEMLAYITEKVQRETGLHDITEAWDFFKKQEEFS